MQLARPPIPIRRGVGQWIAEAVDGAHAPRRVERFIAPFERAAKAREWARVDPGMVLREQSRLLALLEDDLPAWTERRESEQRFAHRLLAINGGNPPTWIRELAESMLLCRTAAGLAVQAGAVLKLWEHKCSCKLCPDEARAAQRRLITRYPERITEWVAADPRHRVFYAVLTAPHWPAGELMTGKRALFQWFTERVLKLRYPACPLTRERGIYLATRRRTMPAFPGVKGALAVQEDPASARGLWNVHLNVLLLVKGPLDYAELRAAWGANLHIEELDRAGLTQSLPGALKEILKYSAKLVPTESDARDPDAAPAMVDWSDAQLLEYVAAQQGERGVRRRAPFRRVRSYGVLHSLEACRWNEADTSQRRAWVNGADQVPGGTAPDRGPSVALLELRDALQAAARWREVPRDGRGLVRAVWDVLDGFPDEPLALDGLLVTGKLIFTPGAGYWVDLIRGNNFDGSERARGWGNSRNATGPPI